MKRINTQEQPLRILKLSNPVYAYLEITYACEGKCPGCPALSAPDRVFTMPGTEWAEIIGTLAPLMEEVRLTGGEPTLHPDFITIIEALKREKLPFRIYTNGLWPDTGRLLKALKGNRSFKGFYVSLHGINAGMHEFFSGLSDFSTITSNIKRAVKAGLPVYTSSVIGAYNAEVISALMSMTAQLGSIRHHLLRYIGPYRGGISLFRGQLKAILELIDQIPPKIFSFHAGECYPKCFYYGARPCYAAITHITLTPAGMIKPCPFSSEILGTWRNGGMTGKRKLHAWASDFHEECTACDEIGACMGGCRTMRRAFHFKRDPLMEELICQADLPKPPRAEGPIIIDGRPKLRASVREERFGKILFKDGEVIPVTDKAFRILALCDGTRGLGDIEEAVGPKVKEFLISLYLRGFLEVL